MSNPISFALRLIYGCYTWTIFTILGLFTLLLLLITPGINNRRVLAQWSARILLRVAAIRFDVINPQLLPDEPCVVVANHCSYLDGLLMKAALPARFSFVIKKEMVKVPLAGLLLKRIGSLFVDRASRHSSAMDARRIMREATEGKSLVFFPEGTFTSRVGLQGFHLGAFATAQRAALPVVPIAIHGARRILRPGSPWPRPGVVEVEVLGALTRSESRKDRSQAELLRDQARARILIALGEPDLLVDGDDVSTADAEVSVLD
jgi:1-acyl-sn-glycerol-3-phosphate acyltransferase